MDAPDARQLQRRAGCDAPQQPGQTLKVYMREIPAGVRAAVEDLDRLLSEKRGLAEAKAEGGVQ